MATTTDNARIPQPTRTLQIVGAVGFSVGTLLLAAGPALADPPGNNGTIKVDGNEFDAHPNNEPHVGCTFEIDFYGFDEGDYYAEVTFEAQAPTDGGVLLTDTVFIGEDSSDGGGSEDGLDAQASYDLGPALAGIAPHPEQGHHVKLTIEADGSQGAETKHKVFWLEGCSTPDEPPVVEEEPPVVEEEPPAVEGEPEDEDEVLGNATIAAPADPADVAPATLPRTGAALGLLAGIGSGLTGLGYGLRRLGVRLGGR